jgi:hypothetical protein
MSWTVSLPSWVKKASTAWSGSLKTLDGTSANTKDGGTVKSTTLRNGSNANRLATSEIVLTLDKVPNLYTGQVAKSIQSTSRFPVTSGTKIHARHNATLIASNEDSTCCAEDRYAPLTVGLTISVTDAPVVTNAHIEQALLDLLGVFVKEDGSFDFLTLLGGTTRANID